MGMAVSVPRYTVDDLEGFPDDGDRYELLDGILLVTPAPRRCIRTSRAGFSSFLPPPCSAPVTLMSSARAP
jgi:hypothetical protein